MFPEVQVLYHTSCHLECTHVVYCFLCPRNYSKNTKCIYLHIPHNNLIRQALMLSPPFYRWGNWHGKIEVIAQVNLGSEQWRRNLNPAALAQGSCCLSIHCSALGVIWQLISLDNYLVFLSYLFVSLFHSSEEPGTYSLPCLPYIEWPSTMIFTFYVSHFYSLLQTYISYLRFTLYYPLFGPLW